MSCYLTQKLVRDQIIPYNFYDQACTISRITLDRPLHATCFIFIMICKKLLNCNKPMSYAVSRFTIIPVHTKPRYCSLILFVPAGACLPADVISAPPLDWTSCGPAHTHALCSSSAHARGGQVSSLVSTERANCTCLLLKCHQRKRRAYVMD